MPKTLKRLMIIAAFISAPFAVSFLGLDAHDASAQVVDYDTAVNEINSRCRSGYTIAHASYGSSPSVNMTTGTVTYNFNVLWKRCNGNYTGEYAITGYDGDACPVIGMYHDGWNGTRDCIKYTDRHGEGRSLGLCGTPRCVYSGFNANVRKGGYNGPPVGTLYSRTIGSRTATIPNWGSVGASTGSTNLFIANICGAHFARVGSWQTIYCTPSFVSVSWVRSNYSLVPSISNVTDGSAIEVPTTGLSVIGAVRNNGPTDSRANAPWQLTKLRYSKNSPIPQKAGGTSVSSSGPCIFFAGEQACDTVASGTRTYIRNNTVNHPGTTDIDDYPVGTRICFAMSVRQYTHTTEDWRHSALSCYVVGKKPKVNILGGDLFVGRAIAGAPSPISTRVVTSTSTNSSGTYGSWGEYAIASSGPVTAMASGSGYVDGSAAYSNLLTFVNSGNTSARCATSNGCYAHASALPSIAERFRTTSATPALSSGSLSGVATGLYRGSGALSLSASTLPAGRSIIINAPTADVTITGDIRYANGPFSNASQLPQLVIIANSITINENVRQVDAWLIAPGRVSGGAVTGGVIRTCNRAPATISEGNCNQVLTVNGPVVANRLILLRTGGSEPNTRRGDPAEIFNFRPDAYIWALQQAQSGGRVTTVSTKELPPRY